jgi:hypothetical protein
MEDVLDIKISPQGAKLQPGEFSRTTTVRSNPFLSPSDSRPGVRPLSPRRTIDKRGQHPRLPHLPTMGQLRPKVTIKKETVKKLDFMPTPKDGPNVTHKAELYMPGDMVHMHYEKVRAKTPVCMLDNSSLMRYEKVRAKSPVRTLDNSSAHYQVRGVRTPTGYQKELIPPLVRDELNKEESVHSTP